MRKEKLVFKYGEEIELPQDIIDDAPSQGAFDDYADYLVNRFDVRCSSYRVSLSSPTLDIAASVPSLSD